ncbi:MAG TPA: glycosyltransferase family 2 protein [Egibacteraceae bacterium]|nr:glycosyltransferase family 2 protein [Egibacteraceae bacterium]
MGVIVVNHNTRDDLLACLRSLAEADADDIVVVDSGSSDASLDAVSAAFPDVRRLALSNVGFGRAANAGVAVTPAELVIVANADTRFPPGSARTLGEHLAARPDVGAMGPMVRFPDGRLQLSARAFPSIGQAVGHAVLGLWKPDNRWTRAYRLTDWDHRSERDVDWISGCCIALRRAAFDDVGGFDPAYFMFVEDVDLCYRLRERGWRVVFSPVVEVTHAIGGAVSRKRFRMVVEHARSLDRFFSRRYATGVRRVLRLPIKVGLAGWVLATITWSIVRGRTHAHG